MDDNASKLEQVKQIFQKRITYPECTKEGFHFGEQMSFICLENNCKNKCLNCSVCVEEEHKSHPVKPLKIVLGEVQQKVLTHKAPSLNSDELIILLETQRQSLLAEFNNIFNSWVTKAKAIEEQYEKFFQHLKDQVLANTQMHEKVINIMSELDVWIKNQDSLRTTVLQMLDFLQLSSSVAVSQSSQETDQQQQMQQSNGIGTNDVKENILYACKEIRQKIVSQNEDVQKVIEGMRDSVEVQLQKLDKSIWCNSLQLSFTDALKHPNVQIISETTVKAAGSAVGYKFALLDPSIQSKGFGLRRFAFKMNQVNPSNWIAIGVCHKQTIVSKSYNFAFQSIGHGAYMISSNGGTWSNTQQSFNNVVKAFKFAKGDIVSCEFDPTNSCVNFSKEKSSETFKLEVKLSDQDQLHACVLFYYLGDEVEVLSNYTSGKVN